MSEPDQEQELKELYALVNRTAKAMRARLKEKMLEGYRGWRWDEYEVRWRLTQSLRKKKWIDVCNLAAMLEHMKQTQKA